MDGFRSKYFSFNLSFIFLLVTITLRTGIYICMCMVTLEFDLFYTKPKVLYLTFATNLMVLFWVLSFIEEAAP